MKTKSILLMFLLGSLTVNAQIKKYNNNMNIKLEKPALKLPVLTVNNRGRFSADEVKKRIRSLPKKKLVEIAANEYAKNASALDVTLTPNKLQNSDAKLNFRGEYSNGKIHLYSESGGSEFIKLGFKFKDNTSYRIKLWLNLETSDLYMKKCGPYITPVHGNNLFDFFYLRLDEHQETAEFIVKSQYGGGYMEFVLLSNSDLKCFHENRYVKYPYSFQFSKVRIRELEN